MHVPSATPRLFTHFTYQVGGCFVSGIVGATEFRSLKIFMKCAA